MTPVPLDLPLRPPEAAELAALIFETAEGRPLTDELRRRIAARAAGRPRHTIVPYFGSLERDPVHLSTYYLAVDVSQGPPQLLHLAPASAPTSSIFPKPLLVGRMHRTPGPEIVINTIPFGPADSAALESFASRVAPAFLPRPHSSRATIVAPPGPETFEAFQAIRKRTGRNMAAIGAAVGDPAAGYYAGLWSAIRSGWRDGYSAVVRLSATEIPPEAALFSAIVFDAAPLSGAGALPEAECAWAVEQFAGTLPAAETLLLTARFGPVLLAAEKLRNHVRQLRAARKINRPFDFELALDRLSQPAPTARELAFCLQWLKARGHAVQLAAPQFAGLSADQARELAAVCRAFQCAVDISPEFLPLAGALSSGAAGRLTCSVWDGPPNVEIIGKVAESLLG